MGDFEKDLKNAFEGVEFTPSERVWEGVQAGLAPKKKRAVFFMWQTYGIAAAIAFMLTMGFVFSDQLFKGAPDPINKTLTENTEDDKSQKETSTNQPKGDTLNSKQLPPSALDPSQNAVADAQSPAESNTTSKSAVVTPKSAINPVQGEGSNQLVAQENAAVPSADVVDPVNAEVLVGENSIEAVSGRVQAEERFALYRAEIRPLPESIASLKFKWEMDHLVEPMELELKDASEWVASNDATRGTALNGSLGSGAFSPNSVIENAGIAQAEATFDDMRFDALSSVSNGSEQQLGSLSIGFGLGYELGKRWVFRTGLRYSQYRFASTSNAFSVENGQSLPIYAPAGFDNTEVLFVGTYDITNTLHSLAIPAQFGFRFLTLDRFSVAVNMGLAADFFISYSVKGDLNFLEKRSVDLGESNLFNRFNINVLTGIELNYQLNEKFALSGEIFLRQYVPISVKGDVAYNATPSFIGFGLGVNYYLRKKK